MMKILKLNLYKIKTKSKITINYKHSLLHNHNKILVIGKTILKNQITKIKEKVILMKISIQIIKILFNILKIYND